MKTNFSSLLVRHTKGLAPWQGLELVLERKNAVFYLSLHYIIKLLKVLFSLKRNVNKHPNDKKAEKCAYVGLIGAVESERFDDEKYFSPGDCS